MANYKKRWVSLNHLTPEIYLSVEVMLKAEEYSNKFNLSMDYITDSLELFVKDYTYKHKNRIFTQGMSISDLEKEANVYLIQELKYNPENLGLYV